MPTWKPPPPAPPPSSGHDRLSVLEQLDTRTLNSQMHLRMNPYKEAATLEQTNKYVIHITDITST